MNFGFTSKSMGDLPDLRDGDDWMREPVARNKNTIGRVEAPADHWTDSSPPNNGSQHRNEKAREKDRSRDRDRDYDNRDRDRDKDRYGERDRERDRDRDRSRERDRNKDRETGLFDNEALPDPEAKTPSRFTLFKRSSTLHSEGEKLQPSRYGNVREVSLEEQLARTDLTPPPRRERSTSLGRLKSKFSVFNKYEGLGPVTAPNTEGLLSSPSEETSPAEEETTFRSVHYCRRDLGGKSKEDATATVVFSPKGVYIVEQPSGDFIDDISPAVVKKYFVDPNPKACSFNLHICRKSSYASNPQSEYTVILMTKHFDLMCSLWKEIIKGHGISVTPVLDELGKKEPSRTTASPPPAYGKNTPFGQEEYYPRSSPADKLDNDFSPRGHKSSKNGGSQYSKSASDLPTPKPPSPRNQQPQKPPPKQERLLIDL